MTEKRFTFADGFNIVAIKDNDKIMNSKQVCNKLNELHEENKQLKQVAKDFVENPTQHNLWKLRTVVLKDSDIE